MGVVVEACRTSCTNNGRPRFRDTRVTLDGPSKLRVRDVCADEPGRCGRAKLEAIGFGIFIPFFFVTSGVRYDAGALFSSGSTIARVPLFLAVLLFPFAAVSLLRRSGGAPAAEGIDQLPLGVGR